MSAKDIFSYIGLCAVAYWLASWLLLVSKNENVPGWLNKLAMVLCVGLGFISLPFSAIFSIPLYINSQQTCDKVRREGYDEAKDLCNKLHEKDYDKGYEKGWSSSRSLYRNRFPDLLNDPDELLFQFDILSEDYCRLYQFCALKMNRPDILNDLYPPDQLTLDLEDDEYL